MGPDNVITKPMEIQKDISSLGGCYGAGTDGEDTVVLLIGQYFHIMQSNPLSETLSEMISPNPR